MGLIQLLVAGLCLNATCDDRECEYISFNIIKFMDVLKKIFGPLVDLDITDKNNCI